ncbi:MAG: DUF2203 domain-containing protein [Bdellovibrionales bacterium]|nr:DUF2203 domain-containing protein [Bdellovibrionales bacterium]
MQEDRGLITINRSGGFSIEEAREILPVVRRITQEYSVKVEALIARLESMDPNSTGAVNELENQVNEWIKSWHIKIKKLGAKPKGLWLVDFDAGDGYYCWKYPEKELNYWHAYDDGYTGRKPIEEVTRQRAPLHRHQQGHHTFENAPTKF